MIYVIVFPLFPPIGVDKAKREGTASLFSNMGKVKTDLVVGQWGGK
jgi:hypothetical protein